MKHFALQRTHLPILVRMSDNDNNIPKTQPLKTQPLKKTSAVPLRKETVRVTLKATPGGVQDGSPAPNAAPPAAMTPPDPDTAPQPTANNDVASSVGLPDVTSAVPLKAETMRVTLKAESAPPSTGPVGAPPTTPRPAAAAPTIPLGGGSFANATVPLATQPLNAGGSSQPLPQATVQLQQTQQLTPGAVGSQAATIQTTQDDESSRRGEGLAGGLAVAVFFAALVVLGVQFSHMNTWVGEKEGAEIVDELFK